MNDIEQFAWEYVGLVASATDSDERSLVFNAFMAGYTRRPTHEPRSLRAAKGVEMKLRHKKMARCAYRSKAVWLAAWWSRTRPVIEWHKQFRSIR